MIQDALAGAQPGQSGGPAPPPTYNADSQRFELAATDNEPAATSAAQADVLAGQAIQGLRILYGDQTINELSVPRSHSANVQSAVLDYLASKVTLAGVLARLTKGQVKAFIGKFGEAVMAKVFPNARLQVPVPGFPGRIADQIEGNIVREVKTGGFDVASKTLQRQIAIDAQMVKAGFRVEWWNVKSPFGRQQFSDDLVSYLRQHGIVPVSHIAP